MSRTINEITLLGNVGADPEARTTAGGSRVATFSLATSRVWKAEGTKQERTEWHRCVVWNGERSKLADLVADHVRKGSRLYLRGRVEYRQWQDKEGLTRYSTEVTVRELIFLDAKPAGAPERPYKAESDDDDDDPPPY